MGDYRFFVSHLRFIANRTDRTSGDVSSMMTGLLAVADDVESQRHISVAYGELRLTGRGLAGVAGFLQQHILPEVVAVGDPLAERQVRWVIDTCMSFMSTLMVHAETKTDNVPCILELPAAPEGHGNRPTRPGQGD